MFRLYPNEVFREFSFPVTQRRRYAISNRGRMVSFTDKPENGTLLRGSDTDGYRAARYKVEVNGKQVSKPVFFYKLVAEHFIPKDSEDQTYVLHLDYVRDNDEVSNLKWATREQMLDHMRKSPHVIRAKKALIEHNTKSDGWKLTATKVMLIKKLLNNPERKTRLKILAKQFGISETHLKRIQSGQNWGHIKV